MNDFATLIAQDPYKFLGLYTAFIIMAYHGIIIPFITLRSLKDLMKENTKYSPEKIELYAYLYAFPHAFFWIYLPTKFIQLLITKFKRRKNHD